MRDDDEILEPRPLHNESGAEKSSGSGRGPNGIWIALGIIAVGVTGLFFLSRTSPPVPPPPERTPTPVVLATPTVDPAPRREAESELDALMDVLRTVRPAKPERWGGETWSAVTENMQAGDQAMAEKDFETAARMYRGALAPARLLAARLPGLPGELMPLAEEAVAAGERDRAVAYLEAVLAVAPDHEAAAALLPRAEMADQSLKFLQAARVRAEAGEWDLAMLDLERLKEMDDQFPGLAELERTVTDALAEREFTTFFSRALLAAEEGNLDQAEKLLEQARTVKPNADALQDLQAQIEEIRTQQRVLVLRDRALALEQKEQWKAAHRLWLEIHALDDQTPWVRAGRDRTLRWSIIDTKLDRALAAPGSRQAEVWAEEFMDREGWPEGLDAKAADLVQKVRLWNAPVTVTLESDGETEVTIPKVGRWNDFHIQKVSLKPGSYVAKGGRLGYRDVRVEFEVVPGEEAPTVKVVPTEGI